MNTQETLFQLKELKLNGMAAAYDAILSLSVQNKPSLDMAVAQMVEAEIQNRKERRMRALLRTSRLRYDSVLEDVICSAERNFTKDNLASLADCSFIRRHENLLIQGKCGCGKSFLACALGRQACLLGYKTQYYNMNTFVERISLSKLDGSFLKLLKALEKSDLLILDDFGLQQMDSDTRLALLQILEDRYERRSLIIVSQLPVNQWYEYLGDATIADAIMDRLVANNAGIVELKGESLRQKKRK